MTNRAELTYLVKVEAKGVFVVKGYTAKRGAYYRFEGGETTAKKFAAVGLLRMPATPDLGRPSYAALTDAGRDRLAYLRARLAQLPEDAI